MKVLFSILFNALILWLMTYFLAANTTKDIAEWIIVTWWYKTYIIWGILLWIMNVIIRPILKILSLPLFFVFLGLVSFLINWVILWMFDKIVNDVLLIPGVSYTITGEWLTWWTNFIIAVAIFTILNMVYSLLFSKR